MDVDDEGIRGEDSRGEGDEETSTTEATDSMFATNGVCVLRYFNYSTLIMKSRWSRNQVRHIRQRGAGDPKTTMAPLLAYLERLHKNISRPERDV